MPMAAVAAEDNVTRFKMIDDTYRIGFLSDVAMSSSKKLTRGKELKDSLLEPANQHHLRIEMLAKTVVPPVF